MKNDPLYEKVAFRNLYPSFVESVIVEMSRWHAFDKSRLIEHEQIQGDLFTCMQRAEAFIQSHTLAFQRNYAGGCFCQYCYPMEAIKQCFYICFMKNDFQKSKSIQIDIFQDRMEFSFWGLSDNKVNQDIAKILKKNGDVESLKRCFERIEDCYREEEKNWKVDKRETRIKIILENTDYRPVDADEIQKLRLAARKCYEMILEHPGIQLKELADRLNRPYITVQTEVRNLRKKRLVERRGKVMSGGYYCIDRKHD